MCYTPNMAFVSFVFSPDSNMTSSNDKETGTDILALNQAYISMPIDIIYCIHSMFNQICLVHRPVQNEILFKRMPDCWLHQSISVAIIKDGRPIVPIYHKRGKITIQSLAFT